jgi:hypothetical protein
MSGSIPPIPQHVSMARYLVQLRGNFTFTFNYLRMRKMRNIHVYSTNQTLEIVLSMQFPEFR